MPGLRTSWLRRIALVAFCSVLPTSTLAQQPLPDPLTLAAVAAYAREHRQEILAARARAVAAHQRPPQEYALDDPMVQWSVDHYPFQPMDDGSMDAARDGRRFGRSFSIEQRFPLSRIRQHRRRVARADASRLDAEHQRVVLDVQQDAVNAMVMLHEQRQMHRVTRVQLALAGQLVAAAAARYASGPGSQADVLRAEVEVARVQARLVGFEAGVRGAESMFNATVGREVTAPVPGLRIPARLEAPSTLAEVLGRAVGQRPELTAADAERRRADAELDVMRSMFRPMAMVRVGVARTMADGDGGMLMVGVSVPLWRGALRAGVDEAEAMREMARADALAMRTMIEGDVAAARERVMGAQSRWQALQDDVLPRARIASASALAGYRAGKGDMVSVVESARALWDTEAEQVMAEAELSYAWSALDRATADLQGSPK
jgi:outer membrane protein TolC